MHSPLARSGFSQITRRCGTSLGRGLVLKAHWHAIGLADVNAIGAYGASAVKYRVDAFNMGTLYLTSQQVLRSLGNCT